MMEGSNAAPTRKVGIIHLLVFKDVVEFEFKFKFYSMALQ